MTWMPKPPDFDDFLANLTQKYSVDKVMGLASIGPLASGRYHHWEKVRYLPTPDNLTADEHWGALKMARKQLYIEMPLIDVDGDPFNLALHPALHRSLHRIDMAVGGAIAGAGLPGREGLDAMLLRSFDDEGISSSQLEGATTTRRVAREMLRSGRTPRSKSEQMILNNVEAMRLVREAASDPLTPELIRTVHTVVTQKTLEPGDEPGFYRVSDDEIGIFDEQGRTPFVPPAAESIEERIKRLCDFANRLDDAEPFVHPVVQSILLHFWLAYIHPFVDGNGRTARALFYWSMLRHGYWMTEYLSISRVLKSAPGGYKRAFLRTETDENDLTYFVDHQLDVIMKATDALHRYIEKKTRDGNEMRRLLEKEQARSDGLNDRQLALMRHALRHAGYTYRIAEHRGLHGIAYDTARTDLTDLVDRGLMILEKVGRAYGFRVPDDLAARMNEKE